MFRIAIAAFVLALLASACATAPRPVSAASYQTVIEGDRPAGASLELRADRAAYQRGDTIALALINRGQVSYGRDAGCRLPVAVWLRDRAGTTYFLRSGERRSCSPLPAPIAPGQSLGLVEIDSALVWLDRSGADSLYRIPAPLPAGAYSVHASLPIGELVTAIEIR